MYNVEGEDTGHPLSVLPKVGRHITAAVSMRGTVQRGDVCHNKMLVVTL
jgi:hypothetical protein